MKQLLPVVCLSALLASCSSWQRAEVMDTTALAVAAPIAPVVAGYRAVTGTNYKRILLVPEVYKLKEGVYVLSNDGGWFTEGAARYGGRGTSHICLSAWIVSLKKEKKDRNGRIVLSKQNLDNSFWDWNNPSKLTVVPKAVEGGTATEYFRADGKSPFVTIVVGGQAYELTLDQT